MRDLLREAIADAKAVRETALANAKIALEEAFTPRLQSMLSARLSEEDDMEEPEMTEEEEMDMEEPEMTEEEEMDMEEPVAEGDEEDYMAEEEEDMEEPVSEEEDMDTELEEILRELEGDDEMTEEEDMEMTEEEDMEMTEEEHEEEVSIEEVIRALREEEHEEEVTEEEEPKAEEELAEAIKVIKFLKSKLNEVNLLNAKLLFSNKLFRNYPLSEGQKMKVIENFDRARTVREVKLVYGTISESLKTPKTKRPMVKESYASKPSRSTAPKKAILSEGNDLAARWKKLANLK
jgi:flagellar biosynthesis/type III secretory pathway chaperone